MRANHNNGRIHISASNAQKNETKVQREVCIFPKKSDNAHFALLILSIVFHE
jgi:hypothetical protein